MASSFRCIKVSLSYSVPTLFLTLHFTSFVATMLARGIRVGICNLDGMGSSLSSNRRLFSALATIEHSSFDVISATKVPDFSIEQATLYQHKASGAEVLSLRTQKEVDDNKVFGISFRTPPADSTGVAHILEHSVLCGSRKYTSKEPFVALLKGSLQTFLNAMTYPDRTVYPVASRNTKDFYNLVNVYLDAVLFPRAAHDPRILAQEGWHYELDAPDDPLVYKGVVYNEMKGVYSQPESLLYRLIQQSLFPNTTYAVDSGGDPIAIPDLTFDAFSRFHAEHYHPSNSRVFFYGDDEERARLDIIDEYFSAVASRESANSTVEWTAKQTGLAAVQGQYPVSDSSDPDQGKIYTTTNWIVNDEPMTSFEEMAMAALDHLLLGTSASVLRKTLLDSGLGSDVVGGGFSGELLQGTYSVGMKGVKTAKDAERVHGIMQSCLENLSLTDNAIAASMNTLEFRIREFNTGGYPKGLLIMLGAMSKWNYGCDPIATLAFEQDLALLKAEASPEFFERLARKRLVDNSHRVRVDLLPSTTLEGKMVEAESAKLRDAKAAMSSLEIDEVIEKTAELRALQSKEDSTEDKATIPRLSLSDIERESKFPLRNVTTLRDGSTLITHPAVASSGILYAEACLDISPLDLEKDVPLLPLFLDMLTQTGTSSMDRVAFQEYIGMSTGGVGASVLRCRATSTVKLSQIRQVGLHIWP